MGERNTNSPEKDEIIAKYNRLTAQSETLRQRLITTSHSSYSDTSSPILTPFTTPERTLHSTYTQTHNTEQPYPLPIWSQPSTEETLYETNQQIKSTLTELLNCEGVKHDKEFRGWVQAKLMDAELELRRQRRRRSSIINGEALRAFGEHTGWGNGMFERGWRNDG